MGTFKAKTLISLFLMVLPILCKSQGTPVEVIIDSSGTLIINKRAFLENDGISYMTLDSAICKRSKSRYIKSKHGRDVTIKYPNLGIVIRGTQIENSFSFASIDFDVKSTQARVRLLGTDCTRSIKYKEIIDNPFVNERIVRNSSIAQSTCILLLKISNSYCDFIFDPKEDCSVLKSIFFMSDKDGVQIK